MEDKNLPLIYGKVYTLPSSSYWSSAHNIPEVKFKPATSIYLDKNSFVLTDSKTHVIVGSNLQDVI